MIPRTAPIAGLLFALVLACSAGPTLAADPNEFSRAENLVFVDRHLGNLKPPTALRYEYVKSGALEPGFTDGVRVEVDRSGKACCTVKTTFLSGERLVDLPPLEGAESNPVILYFLERDVREMARLTARKSGNYFRNRIRRTMVEEAKVRDTTVSWQGKDLPAREVTLTPYDNDPARSRFERYAKKQYTFLLAPGVPGGVFQIRSSMAGSQAGDPALMIEEVMSFAGTDTAPAAPAAKR
ncbi:MAG TPA: hypothetical protein VLI72_13925 [Methylibium sp.]|nr:hypothetical protein [Methylibium sp.]